jgi:hypothetical protein
MASGDSEKRGTEPGVLIAEVRVVRWSMYHRDSLNAERDRW